MCVCTQHSSLNSHTSYLCHESIVSKQALWYGIHTPRVVLTAATYAHLLSQNFYLNCPVDWTCYFWNTNGNSFWGSSTYPDKYFQHISSQTPKLREKNTNVHTCTTYLLILLSKIMTSRCDSRFTSLSSRQGVPNVQRYSFSLLYFLGLESASHLINKYSIIVCQMLDAQN